MPWGRPTAQPPCRTAAGGIEYSAVSLPLSSWEAVRVGLGGLVVRCVAGEPFAGAVVLALVVCVAVLDVACPGGLPPTGTVFVEDPQGVITSATVRGAAARRVRRAHLMAA